MDDGHGAVIAVDGHDGREHVVLVGHAELDRHHGQRLLFPLVILTGS